MHRSKLPGFQCPMFFVMSAHILCIRFCKLFRAIFFCAISWAAGLISMPVTEQFASLAHRRIPRVPQPAPRSSTRAFFGRRVKCANAMESVLRGNVPGAMSKVKPLNKVSTGNLHNEKSACAAYAHRLIVIDRRIILLRLPQRGTGQRKNRS